MPRTWTRTTNRGQFTEGDLVTTLHRIRKGGLSRNEAARTYHVGRATLGRYLKDNSMEISKISRSYRYSNTLFTREEELSLKEHVETCGAMAYGLTVEDLCKLAYQYALLFNKTMPPKWRENKATGKCWASAFRTRNQLSLRLPENTSITRATAFNYANVKLFHEVY